MADVIVIGGGVIGQSIAYELAKRGSSVQVLEQGVPGREASWAGAGMLPPGNVAGARTPEARLRSASHDLWPAWSECLRDETGIDNGYQRCGGVLVADPLDRESAAGIHRRWLEEGVTAELLPARQFRERCPCLNPEIAGDVVHLPAMGQVRNPWHLKALTAGCIQRGVRIDSGHQVIGMERNGEKIQSVQTPLGKFSAGEYVFAGGAWSAQLLAQAGVTFTVEPVRGQIVLLDQTPPLLRTIVEQGKRYIVPRGDGKILIGSTEERVGFVKANTAAAVAELIRFSVSLVPALQSARFEQAWSGLRPYRAGELPHIGRIEGLQNACVAAGHFRAGLQMSPITAMLIRQIILGEPVQLPLECSV